VNIIGSNMALRLEQANKSGLIYGYSFDAYWIGGTRNTGWWKNITGLLLETASARIATPIYIEPNELRGGTKGSSTTRRPSIIRTRGRAAGGGCATSWTTSASPRTRCWSWRRLPRRPAAQRRHARARRRRVGAPGEAYPHSRRSSATGRPRSTWPG
jgi:hypothetical protein